MNYPAGNIGVAVVTGTGTELANAIYAWLQAHTNKAIFDIQISNGEAFIIHSM